MKILITGCDGYIGSYLKPRLERTGFIVWGIDQKPPCEGYQNEALDKYDAIIHLAAHSNVRICEQDPSGAFYNNVVWFYDLVHRMRPDQLLIYASSASIYNGQLDVAEDSNIFNPSNMYDFSKYSMDALMKVNPNPPIYYSLRFGTVNGPSPKIREELIVNAMVKSAMTSRKIQVTNGHCYRSILWIEDLVRVIETILVSKSKETSGVYNICSFSDTIENIGLAIGSQLDECDVEVLKGGKSTYSFSMLNDKFKNTFNFDFKGSLNVMVRELESFYKEVK